MCHVAGQIWHRNSCTVVLCNIVKMILWVVLYDITNFCFMIHNFLIVKVIVMFLNSIFSSIFPWKGLNRSSGGIRRIRFLVIVLIQSPVMLGFFMSFSSNFYATQFNIVPNSGLVEEQIRLNIHSCA